MTEEKIPRRFLPRKCGRWVSVSGESDSLRTGVSAGSEAEADRLILGAFNRADVNLVVLSGYLRMVGPLTLDRYRNRVLNIHPALLPKYGGKGMYGRFVHEAVLRDNETISGASVHLVDEVYDHGPVVGQKSIPVYADDTVESLRNRVVAIEGDLFVETLRGIAARGLEAFQASVSP